MPANAATPADVAFEAGDWATAADAYAEQVRRAPTDGRAWARLAGSLYGLARWSESADAWGRADALAWNTATTRYNLTCSLALAGRTDEALDALERTLAAGYAGLDHLRGDPDLASLHDSPRFAAATAPLALVQVLGIVTGREGLREDPAVSRKRIDTLCEPIGSAAACALRKVDLSDPAAIGAALGPACETGDPAACLGVAWTLVPPGAAGLALPHPTDGPRFRHLVQGACDAGLARACTDLGWVREQAIATYPDRGSALRLWGRACALDEPAACTAGAVVVDNLERLRDVADEDVPVALAALAAQVPESAPALYTRACTAGFTSACGALAATGPLEAGPRAQVKGACAAGDPGACARLAALDAADGRVPVAEAIARLDTACAVLPSACEEAAFLRQGAPPVGGYFGPLPATTEITRGLNDSGPALHACLLEAAARGHDADRWIDVVLRLAPDGAVVGVHVPEPPDPEYATCAAAALRSGHIRPLTVASTRVQWRIPAFHGAAVEIRTDRMDLGGQITPVASDTPTWGVPLDACQLASGDVAPGIALAVQFLATRGGRLRNVEVARTSEDPVVDRCVVDWLAEHELSAPVGIPTRMTARIRFLEPRVGAPVPPAPPARSLFGEIDPGLVVAPVSVRMLVLNLPRSTVDGKRARLSAASLRSIEEAHLGMADAVHRWTDGAVTIVPTFRTVDSVRVRPKRGDGEEGRGRWLLEPSELPDAVRDAIEPGEWDSVFLWTAIPLGYPQPWLGTSFGSATVRGAPAVSGMLPSRTEIHSNQGLPGWEVVLHEWWHQVEARADLQLQLRNGWPPRNHEPLRVGDRTLDARSWLRRPDPTDVLDWYETVLGALPPEFWRDAWQPPERIVVEPENLALRGRPWAEGVDGAEALTDTVLSFGGFMQPRAREGAASVWFGVGWDEPVQIERVVVHLGLSLRGNPELPPSVLEVYDHDRWRAVDATLADDGLPRTYTFAPTEVTGMRLRFTGNTKGLVCPEIETY